MNSEKKLPALNVNAADLTPSALVVGDPQRAAAAAEYLEDKKKLATSASNGTLPETNRVYPLPFPSTAVARPAPVFVLVYSCRSG